jgi:hypothetical protein
MTISTRIKVTIAMASGHVYQLQEKFTAGMSTVMYAIGISK